MATQMMYDKYRITDWLRANESASVSFDTQNGRNPKRIRSGYESRPGDITNREWCFRERNRLLGKGVTWVLVKFDVYNTLCAVFVAPNEKVYQRIEDRAFCGIEMEDIFNGPDKP